MQNNNFRSLKLIEKKKRRKKIRNIIFSIVGISIFVLVIFLLNMPAIQIERVVVDGGKFTDKKAIEEIAKQNMNGSYFFLIKKSNYFFYPQFGISKQIKEKFISIKELNISRNSFNEISIDIQEYLPSAVTCKNDLKTECYLVNEEGMIFANGPLMVEGDVIELANFYPNLNIGEKYGDVETFKKVILLAKMMKEKGFHPDLVSTEDNESFNLHISEGPHIFYEKNDDPKEVLINLLTVIEKDSLNKSQFQNIDYIDLRFGNKVYYKIK